MKKKQAVVLRILTMGAIAGHFQKHLKVILLLNNEPLRSKYFLYSKSDADNMC